MKGRRRPDTKLGSRPSDVRPGDYWKVLDEDGNPLVSTEEGNLTNTVWMVAAPVEGGQWWVGTLTKHTVREHDDGTCSIRPGDGSSNSLLIDSGDVQWHGYLEHGEWSSA